MLNIIKIYRARDLYLIIGSQSSWLITPDTMLLYRSGAVKFCPGIPAGNRYRMFSSHGNINIAVLADGNDFIAPELYGVKQFDTCTADELERTYVYSLGMTIYYALEHQTDPQVGQSQLMNYNDSNT